MTSVTRSGYGRPGAIEKDEGGVMFGRAAAHKSRGPNVLSAFHAGYEICWLVGCRLFFSLLNPPVAKIKIVHARSPAPRCLHPVCSRCRSGRKRATRPELSDAV